MYYYYYPPLIGCNSDRQGAATPHMKKQLALFCYVLVHLPSLTEYKHMRRIYMLVHYTTLYYC